MRQNNPERSFYSLLTLLAVLAGIVLLLSIFFSPENWLRQTRLSLSPGIHSPLFSDYSADLHGVLAAPAEMRLLEEALIAQQVDPSGVVAGLLTPVPTVTPRPDGEQLTQTALVATTAVVSTDTPTGPTATLPPGVTPSPTATPTLTAVLTQTARPSATLTATGLYTRTPGPSATPTIRPSDTSVVGPTATLAPTQTPSHTPTGTISPTHTPTRTLTRTPTHTPTRTPTRTPTPWGYPPPETPYPTIPGYP